MSLILRNAKGSALTYTEMDDNLEYLEDLIVGTSGSGLYLPLSGGTMSGDLELNSNLEMSGDIEMDDGQVIKAVTGAGQIDLRDVSNGFVTITGNRITLDSSGSIDMSNSIPIFPEYTVASLPNPGNQGGVIMVTDETGGYTMAFSDGTNWRRVQDRAIVS